MPQAIQEVTRSHAVLRPLTDAFMVGLGSTRAGACIWPGGGQRRTWEGLPQDGDL